MNDSLRARYVDDKNNHMKRTRLVIVIWFLLSALGFGRDEKTEVVVFAGGYFNSGFQSFKILNQQQAHRSALSNQSARRTAVFSG